MIYTLDRIFGSRSEMRALLRDPGNTHWVTAVAARMPETVIERLAAAWSVLCGGSVALRYPLPGELEIALGEAKGIDLSRIEKTVTYLFAPSTGQKR